MNIQISHKVKNRKVHSISKIVYRFFLKLLTNLGITKDRKYLMFKQKKIALGILILKSRIQKLIQQRKIEGTMKFKMLKKLYRHL